MPPPLIPSLAMVAFLGLLLPRLWQRRGMKQESWIGILQPRRKGFPMDSPASSAARGPALTKQEIASRVVQAKITSQHCFRSKTRRRQKTREGRERHFEVRLSVAVAAGVGNLGFEYEMWLFFT